MYTQYNFLLQFVFECVEYSYKCGGGSQVTFFSCAQPLNDILFSYCKIRVGKVGSVCLITICGRFQYLCPRLIFTYASAPSWQYDWTVVD